jgi:cation:H+ antiporter
MPAGLSFALALALILVASELFTNGIEWTGHRLGLGHGATGSLLAALGTALPETVVPVVAILGRQPDAQQVAIGAVLGGPFLLLTLGLGITGIAVWLRRANPVMSVDPGQLRRDITTYYLGTSVLAIALVLPLGARVVGAVLLLVIYARHIVLTLRQDAGHGDIPDPLHLWRFRGTDPPTPAVLVQVAVSIGTLILGARLFVDALDTAASQLHISALVLAIVLVPFATELPETFNSVLWVRSNDDILALGNVAGATAFQACIPGAIGLAFTEWRPGAVGMINGAVTLVAAAWCLVLLRDGRCSGWRLACCGFLWVGFVASALILGERLAPVSA